MINFYKQLFISVMTKFLCHNLSSLTEPCRLIPFNRVKIIVLVQAERGLLAGERGS